MKLTADNICALIIIFFMCLNVADLAVKTIGVDGLVLLAILVLICRWWYTGEKAR